MVGCKMLKNRLKPINLAWIILELGGMKAFADSEILKIRNGIIRTRVTSSPPLGIRSVISAKERKDTNRSILKDDEDFFEKFK
jgi:hypothetical protein